MHIPKKIFFTKGVGRDRYKLSSLELALRDAGIEKYNIVNVSSIMPPGCKIISKEEGLKMLKPGQIVYSVFSSTETNEKDRLISAAIGIAIPKNNNYGYLSEHHAYGETEKKCGDYAEDLAATMLATTLGIEFDPNQAWKEREKVYKASGHIFKTANICQSAVGKKGLWTTVVAAAVFVDSEDEDLFAVAFNNEPNIPENYKGKIFVARCKNDEDYEIKIGSRWESLPENLREIAKRYRQNNML